MGPILFLISTLLVLAAFVGLILPNKLLFFMKNPSRGKALSYYGLAALLFFVTSILTTPSKLEEALRKPLETKELSLSGKGLKRLPLEITQLENLISLDLSENKFEVLPDEIKSFLNLSHLDISGNPIKALPDWINELKELKTVRAYNTGLVPSSVNLTGVEILFEPLEETPDNPIISEGERIAEKRATKEDHSESFSEFAFRKLLGNDYGHQRKFLKGEVYYDDPVTRTQADAVGEIMVALQFFNEKKPTTVLLEKSEKTQLNTLKVVVVENMLNEQVYNGFSKVRTFVNEEVFPDERLHLVLVDTDLKEIKTLQ